MLIFNIWNYTLIQILPIILKYFGLKSLTMTYILSFIALYLLSDLANGVTGEIRYVDAGYNKVGMPDPKNIR